MESNVIEMMCAKFRGDIVLRKTRLKFGYIKIQCLK